MNIFSSIYLALTAFVVGLVVTAPEGYEDETGFHYGKKDEKS